MFHRLRNYPAQEKMILNEKENHCYAGTLGPYVINHVRDLTTGFDSRTPDKNAVSLMVESAVTCYT